MFNSVFKNKKVLITGNTGFKGSWLSTWLTLCEANVFGYSLNIPTSPSMFEALDLENKINHKFGDIRDKECLEKYINEIKPDFIFHLAAQAIVSTSYANPLDTITTNTIGTAVVLDIVKEIKWDCTVVMITSDKAYENVEWIWGYRENDTMGGKDIYSSSKGAAELIIKSYWCSFIKHLPNIKLGVSRAGNVIGGGDWSNDRIVVDTILAFNEKKSVEIRSPKATRPWQHVLEPLSGYLCLAQQLYESKVENGEAFNFGPRSEDTKTVAELVIDIAKKWGIEKDKAVVITGQIPFEEAKLLKLNCDKALAFLKWHSTLNYKQTVGFVTDWYSVYYSKNEDVYQFTLKQIESFIKEASLQNLNWTK